MLQVKSFFAETTAHGFGNIVKPETYLCYKVTWAVIVVTALTGSVLHLSSVITSYLAYPSQETSQIIQDNPRFPDVTICNAIPLSDHHVRMSVRNGETELSQFLTLTRLLRPELRAYTRRGIPVQSVLEAPYGIFGSVNHEEIKNLSHSFDDFILSCRHSNDICNTDDWIHYLDKDFYNCYTYTGGRHLKSAITGPAFGLSLILFLENIFIIRSIPYNTMSNIENSFGARIVIHDHNTLPSPKQQGIEILPGHSTSIGLRESRIHKLSKPWGDCTKTSKLRNMERYDYTTESCIDVCMAMKVYENCNCIFSFVTDSLQGENIKHCGFFDNDTVTLNDFVSITLCVLKTLDDFGSGDLLGECNCKEKCDYRIFDRSFSQSQWPGIPYQLDFFRELVLNHPEAESLLAYSSILSYYRDAHSNFEEFNEIMYRNFARVNIYFDSLDIVERKQFPSMTITDMFANVGGTIGLWAGLSIVTIVEVVFLWIKLCGLGLSKCKRPIKVEDAENKTL